MKNIQTLRWANWSIQVKVHRPRWTKLHWALQRRQLEMKWKELIRKNRRQ